MPRDAPVTRRILSGIEAPFSTAISARFAAARGRLMISRRHAIQRRDNGPEMRILAAAILFSVASAPAFGMDCADQTQLGLDRCADASFQRADHALNDAYREVVRRLDGDEHKKRLLAAAETAWIALRDTECKFAVSSTENGSIYPMEYSLCLEGETQKRTKDLQAYLHCEEGDLSCPVH
jgi:uncharacterized protein YecT (DUF1311 family)